MNPQPDEAIDWSLTTWEGSRREQLRRWAELSFDEIVAAQEEMAELAEAMRLPVPRAREPSPSGENPPTGQSSQVAG